MTIATATLPPRLSWWVAGTAASCYTLLMFVPMPAAMAHHGGDAFAFHIWGMWYGFLLSAVLVTLFVARIGATLRDHGQALAEAGERAVRDEQCLALGTLAAGTAHELGTPLSTMAVIAADLADEWQDTPDLAERLGVLRSQVERCKGILGRMAMDAGDLRADAGRRMALDAYLGELLDDWQALRPRVQVQAACSGPSPAPQIVAERALTQAIQNILNNAADASPQAVAVTAIWDATHLDVEVQDQGAGLAPSLAGRIGEPLGSASTGQGGLGLGLYLARTVLERLGGRVDLSPGQPSGVRAHIRLPLAPILAPIPVGAPS